MQSHSVVLAVHSLISFLDNSKYFLLFLGTFVEGPFVMISSGFLWHMGVFDFLPMYIVLVFSNVIADTTWYTIGYFGARPLLMKYGKFFHATPEIIEKLEKLFQKHEKQILIINKLTSGFGMIVLVLLSAGVFRVPFKKYASINLLGGIIFVFALVSLGYFLGNVYIVVPRSLKIGLVVFILAVIVIGFRKMQKIVMNTTI